MTWIPTCNCYLTGMSCIICNPPATPWVPLVAPAPNPEPIPVRITNFQTRLHPDDIDAIARRVVDILREKLK